MQKMTTKAIQSSKKNQRNDFLHMQNYYFHRNPVNPSLQYFDDTFVTLFEVALSLEMQNAFKQSDISYPHGHGSLHRTPGST